MLSKINFISCDFVTNVKRFLQGNWANAGQVIKYWLNKKPDPSLVAQIKPELTTALAEGSFDAVTVQGILIYCQLESVAKIKYHNYLSDALVYFKRAAGGNKAFALHMLSMLYERGKICFLDCVELIQRYEKIVTSECCSMAERALAASDLGFFYANGFGTPQDYIKAKKYYLMAVTLGDLRALSNLGALYESGLGVAQDYVQAKEYYEKTARFGESYALDRLGVWYERGLGVTQDYKAAKEYYAAAAELGEASALAHLGFLYEKGLGVTKEFLAAEKYYSQAVNLGDTYAATRLIEAYDGVACWGGSIRTVRLNSFVWFTERQRYRNWLSAKILGGNFGDLDAASSEFLLANTNGVELQVFLKFFQITNYLREQSKQDIGSDYQIRMNDFWRLIRCSARSKRDVEEYLKSHHFPRSFLHANTYRHLRDELGKAISDESAANCGQSVQLFRKYLSAIASQDLSPGEREMVRKLLDSKIEPFTTATKISFFSDREAEKQTEGAELKNVVHCL